MLSVVVTWKTNCYNAAEVIKLNKVSQGRENLRLLNEQELIIEYKDGHDMDADVLTED